MMPSRHILYGFIFSLTLWAIIPFINSKEFLIIFFSSFLIDIDHCFYYAWKKKDLNPLKARNWFMENTKNLMRLPREERNNSFRIPFIFHGIEILLLLVLLSYFWKPFIFVFAGFAFHLLLDMIDQPRIWGKFTKISLVNDFFKK